MVRDAVRIELAARDGEIADAQVTKTARFILSFMTETERVSLSSRGKIEGYDPPVERFREAAEAFITKFELGEMLASFEQHVHDEEPSPDPGENPPEIDDDTAGSQHSSSSEAGAQEAEPTAQGSAEQEAEPTAQHSGSPQTTDAEPGNQGSEDESSSSAQLTTRKRKVSPSFQAIRSPSAHRYTTMERIQDSTDSPPDWGGVAEERDSSDAESTRDHILDKGKGTEILLPRSPTSGLVAEREELAREREIRNKHRVMPSEPISASALISALQSQLSEQSTQRDDRFVTTPSISHRRSPSSSSSSPSTDLHRRFSVDELGSPGFKPRLAPTQKHDLRNQATPDIELVDAPPVQRTIASSPNDIKVEDAPKPITPHHIPGSWIPSRPIHFGEFKREIPSPQRQHVDNKIELPDAPEVAQSSNEIDLPDAPDGQRRTEEEQLFHSEGARPRVSLPPTPVDHKPTQTRRSFTPTYPPPTSYGARFTPRVLDKSTQTIEDMTAKKIDALEEMMKQMMIANEKRDAALDNLFDTLTKTAARARDDDTEQDKRDAIFRQLEEERLLKEAELKAKYAAAGFEYNTPQGTNNSDGDHNSRTNDRSEHVKIEQVGIVQPLASHAEWTGQAHDSNNNSVWVSFKGWLQHLEAVLSQRVSGREQSWTVRHCPAYAVELSIGGTH
jgi:hypothetical protein